ncbi:MAG TPA: hypothetical protein VLC46_15810 [Thermoanaerobaculia bacterium]|jgi:hypothetical protein|nr:hypothetical protein [Thermoanaerobaculia bacterium]
MPFVRKVGTFLDEVLEFLLSVIHHWRGALTSSVVISVGLTVYQLATREALQLKTYLWTLVGVGLPVAVFLAWAEEYRGRERGQLEINQLKLAPVPDVSAMQEALMHSRNDTDRQREEINRLTEQVEILTDERPRIITSDQSRQIAECLKAWPAYRDQPYNRRAIVLASPQGYDAKNYAGQIRLALERGLIWAEEVIDFTHGDETYLAGEHAEVNQHLLNAHDANITIWGSDTTEHSGEPLDQALLDAFRLAGVDAIHRPGPTSFGGMVAVIVGSGVVTQSARQQEEILRLKEELAKQLRDATPRDISPEQRALIAKHLKDNMPTIRGKMMGPRRVNVVPLPNPPDAPQFAAAIVSVLSASFDSRMGSPDGPALPYTYSLEDMSGIVLLAGESFPDPEFKEHHKRREQLIVDAFAAGGIEITRRECEFRIRETTLLVGRRA